MGIKYNSLNVDERYSSILEPNLYYNEVMVPGVTFTDKYQTGPAGQIYVHMITTSAVESGKPGRDFTDTAVADTLIPIQLNNNFQRSYKIYGVQAAAVDFAVGEEALSTATKEIREGWMQAGIACLAQEGTAATLTDAITDVKADIIESRKELVLAKGRADVVLCTPGFYGEVLKAAGSEYTPVHNDRIASTGNVGQWLGMTFIEANGANGSIKYYDSTGTQKTVDLSDVQYIMYYHEALSIVSNFEVARLIDSERFAGSLAQVEMNTGYKVTNADLVLVRSVASE